MAVHRRDIDDESLFDHQTMVDRKAKRQREVQNGLERERLFDERDARIRENVIAETKAASEAMLISEYHRYGVEPYRCRATGVLTSLQTLLSLGWSIQQISGLNVLVAPPPIQKYDRRDKDSLS